MRNKFVLGILLSLVCSFKAIAQDNFESQKKAYESLENDLTQKWVNHKSIQEEVWKKYQEQIRQKWIDGIMPSVKTNVEYWDNDQSRMRIDYEKGVVYLETISEKKLLKEDIAKNFQQGLIQNENLIENQIQFKNGKTLNKDSPEELNKQMNSYVQEYGAVTGEDGKKRNLYRVELPMVPDHVKRRANKYLPYVMHWSNKYSLPPALILAIMWQESAFNPKARSHIPAFGLMQIVPRYAGEDVKIMLGESNVVDGDFLYNPENNLRYGTSYLKILSDKSFAEIKPFEKRVPFIIAGYNWGPSRLLKHLKKGSIKLNSPREIKEQIYKIAPKETKDYLLRVIDNWKRIELEKWI